MKKIFMLTSVLTFSIQVNAEYLIKYTVESQPNSIIMVNWQSTSPYYTSWQSIGEVYGCSNWTPDESTITIGQSFTQERTCAINQERFRQDRELSSKGSYKDVGTPQLETRVEDVLQSRSSSGILESWVAIGALYGDWSNSGGIYDCTNWTPLANTIPKDIIFEQTATDCKQDQVRNVQNRELETNTNEIRYAGNVFVESITLQNQNNSQNILGTKANKVCNYSFNFGGRMASWWSSGGENYMWSNNNDIYPNLWANLTKGTYDMGTTPIEGLTKINETTFRYVDANNNNWTITPGAYTTSVNGVPHYQLCFE